VEGNDNRIVGHNIIAANGRLGIELRGDRNVVQGNLIGITLDGAAAGNAWSGILVLGNDNQIGGAAPELRNVISANAAGILLPGNNNKIQGNFIGTGLDGKGTDPGGQPLGNRGGANTPIDPSSPFTRIVTSMLQVLPGVGIGVGATENTFGLTGSKAQWLLARVGGAGNIIGSDGDGIGDEYEGNVIAYNFGPGVGITGLDGETGKHPVRTRIQRNNIHSNQGLGIDLAKDGHEPGLTLNDPLDTDEGPNKLQNWPEISEVTVTSVPVIKGTLRSAPSASFTLDFYAMGVDDQGVEQQRWLTKRDVWTAGNGEVMFEESLAAGALDTTREWIVATATDDDGNTSEFSSVISGRMLMPDGSPAHVKVQLFAQTGTLDDVPGAGPGDRDRYIGEAFTEVDGSFHISGSWTPDESGELYVVALT